MATNNIIVHNSKIPLVSTNKICNFRDFLVTIGYDNVGPVGDEQYRYTVYFKYKFSATSSTNLGIKVPVFEADSYTSSVATYSISSFGSSESLNSLQKNTDTPNYTSPSITGFVRTSWTMSIANGYFNYYTSDSTQKALINTTDTFWFGLNLKTNSPSKFFWGKTYLSDDPSIKYPVGVGNFSFVSYGAVGSTVTFSCNAMVYDFNA